jgi:hypothetical protein
MARLGAIPAGLSCLAAAALVVAGCTSVPQASPGRDAEAKQFNTQPGTATIYVYRPDLAGASDLGSAAVLWLDGRLIGETLPRTFFRLAVRPGRHVLNGQVADVGRIELDTRAGELYFVSMRLTGGTSNFERVSVEAGKRDILRCCAMMENWEPGQRPFLK